MQLPKYIDQWMNDMKWNEWPERDVDLLTMISSTTGKWPTKSTPTVFVLVSTFFNLLLLHRINQKQIKINIKRWSHYSWSQVAVISFDWIQCGSGKFIDRIGRELNCCLIGWLFYFLFFFTKSWIVLSIIQWDSSKSIANFWVNSCIRYAACGLHMGCIWAGYPINKTV